MNISDNVRQPTGLMIAAVLERQSSVESRPLRLTQISIPSPASNEVLIRVAACGVCRTDLHVVEGDLPLRLSPITPGHQIVGTIEKTGESAVGLSIGQSVGVGWLFSTCGRCRFCLSGDKGSRSRKIQARSRNKPSRRCNRHARLCRELLR